MHSAELLVRRKLVEQALLLMMTRDLVDREIGSDGIKYVAGENAVTFLSSLSSRYLLNLKVRASWLIDMYGDYSDEAFKRVMRRFFDKWVEEFQQHERSLGARYDSGIVRLPSVLLGVLLGRTESPLAFHSALV